MKGFSCSYIAMPDGVCLIYSNPGGQEICNCFRQPGNWYKTPFRIHIFLLQNQKPSEDRFLLFAKYNYRDQPLQRLAIVGVLAISPFTKKNNLFLTIGPPNVKP